MTAGLAFGRNHSVSPGYRGGLTGQILDRRYFGGRVGSSVDRRWPPATLLGRVAAPLRVALLSAGTEIEEAGDRPIIRQGDQLGHAYLLIDGVVKVIVRDKNGKEALLD